jgi:hypothetical protein
MNETIEAANGGPNRYKWELKDRAIYVFPEQGYRDPLLNSLLEIEVRKFALKKNTGCRGFVESLAADTDVKATLEDNGIRLAGYNFSGFYFPQMGREFGFETTNSTVKEILDKAVKESPTARFWVIGRNSLETFLLGLDASFEDMPGELRGIRLADRETDLEYN